MLAQPDYRQSLPPSGSSLEITPPLVLDEGLVIPFKYWDEGIQSGIRYNNELYAHHQSFSPNERLKAYEVAYAQTEQGIRVCITVSKICYTVWLSLRSLSQENADSRKEL